MSRIIKFRAWDKVHNLMRGVACVSFDGSKVHSILSTIVLNSEAMVRAPFFELMQFTGLLDKKGVEIFEGDIVKIKADWEEYGWRAGQVGNVVFSEYFYGISLKSQNDKVARYIVYLDANNGKDVKIIGNIYENPELLC